MEILVKKDRELYYLIDGSFHCAHANAYLKKQDEIFMCEGEEQTKLTCPNIDCKGIEMWEESFIKSQVA